VLQNASLVSPAEPGAAANVRAFADALKAESRVAWAAEAVRCALRRCVALHSQSTV
jgi:hypothetical protein